VGFKRAAHEVHRHLQASWYHYLCYSAIFVFISCVLYVKVSLLCDAVFVRLRVSGPSTLHGTFPGRALLNLSYEVGVARILDQLGTIFFLIPI
jgi:hypothetical protein